MSGDERISAFAKDVFAGCTFNSMLVEASKGCVSDVFCHPVELEPFYERFDATRIYRKGTSVEMVVSEGTDCVEWFLCKLKIPLLDKVDWDRFEVVLSSLCGFSGVVSFEVFACGNDVSFFLGSSSVELLSVVCGVWQSVFPELIVLDCDDPFLGLKSVKGRLCVFDLYPSPPYYRRMNVERVVGSLSSFVKAISGLKNGECCFYQTLFCPVKEDWFFNVRSLVASESIIGVKSPFGKSSPGVVKDLCKPLFAVAVRFGCMTRNNVNVAGALKNFCGAFLHSGKPFNYRSEKDFVRVLGKKKVFEMFERRIAHCSGFIVSSDELAQFVHFPDRSVKGFGVHIEVAKGLKVPERLLQDGRPLGFNFSSGREVLVRLPDSDLNKCLWMIGRSRSGKSNSMLHQIDYYVKKKIGTGLIDGHRQTAFELLGYFPKEVEGRVDFLDFDDSDYVLDYNVFDEDDEEFFGRLSVEIVNSLKNLFDAGSFHRMVHLLRMAVYALFVLKKNLVSIPVLFSKTPEGEHLRKEVVARAGNAEVKRFWRSDFYTYPKEAFMPIVNRFSELFLDARASRIFSREKTKVRIDEIMNDGRVLVVALPSAVDLASLVGGMLIAQFQKAAFARMGKPSSRKSFYLFVDEFPRLFSSGKIIESIINETVKAGLHLTLANQETGQLSDELLKSVLSMPNIMVFNVNMLDAKRLAPVFNGKVSVEDIISQETGETFAKLYNDSVDFRCPPPLECFDEKVRNRIIAENRRKLYTPLAVIEKKARKRKPRKRVFDSFRKEGFAMTVHDILNLLHPDVIGERVECLHWQVRDHFRVSKYVADDFKDFARIIVDYYRYHFAEWMGSDVHMPYEHALSDIKELLQDKGGFVNAVRNAERGREGGLIGVINLIAEAVREKAVLKYIDGILTHYINPRDFDFKVCLAEQYLDTYARHVLRGEDFIGPYELASKLEQFLKYHAKWVVSYRNMLT